MTCSSGPLVAVKLLEGEMFEINNIKLIHSSFTRDFSQKESDEQTAEEWINSLTYAPDDDSLVWIEGGNVILTDCQLTMSSIKKPMTAVVALKGALTLKGCEIKGHGEISTCGVYAKGTNLTLTRTKLYKHRGAAIVLDSAPDDKILIEDCTITKNISCGIYCWGEEAKPTIQKTRVMHNDGTGIKVCRFNTASIKACDITSNEVGILIEDADPFVFLCNIKENAQEGVRFTGSEDLRCDGKIMSCEICSNDTGLLLDGATCFSSITSNLKISANKKAGIRVQSGARATVIRNEIFSNSGQGVLVVDGSSAHIERNNIYDNVKANVAFGGSENSDTIVVENSICRSQAEGIVNIAGGKSWIKRNQIFDNFDGIVLIDSHPDIYMNSIYDNRRSGLTVAGKSQPSVMENEVFRNTAVGIAVRDLSSGLYSRNSVYGNLVQVALVTKKHMNVTQVKTDNQIKGEVQIPLPKVCQLF